MSISMKHIASDTDRHGNRRHYVRLPGRAKIRLRSEPGTVDFRIEYERALAKAKASRHRTRQEGHFVYVVGTADGAAMKIGSTADIAPRLQQLQNGNHVRLTLHRLFRVGSCRDAVMLERASQKRLAPHHASGEWFLVTCDEAIAAVEAEAADQKSVVEIVP